MNKNWIEKNKKLVREFEFVDFKKALSFVNKVAKIAEELKHHPDITLHDYKEVKVTTTTHDKKAITNKDKNLANKIDKVYVPLK